MANKAERLRARLLGGSSPTDGRLVEALESRLAADEEVVLELGSPGPLVHEQDGETRARGGSDGGTLLAATDRKLVVVLDTKTGRETADIPFTDVRRIERDDGFLKTAVVLTVWGRGTVRLKPARGAPVDELVDYVRTASQTWQRVVAALQDARQQLSLFETRVEQGEMTAAVAARGSAVDHIETAADRVTVGSDAIRETLTARIETVRGELRETAMRSRASRARTLVDEAAVQRDAAEYDEAYRTLQQAREHFDRALTIAIEDGSDAVRELQADLDDLADQERTLLARPLEAAERARERAQAAGDPEAAVAAWETALDRYRDTLRAGWGADAGFEGDSDALRMQIEWVVATIVRKRRRVATRLESRGDACRDRTDADSAADHYGAAAEQVAAARGLAAEYAAGDETELDEHASRLRAKEQSVQ